MKDLLCFAIAELLLSAALLTKGSNKNTEGKKLRVLDI